MISLGKNIKELRRQKKLSQNQLGLILGISQTSIAHYEAGTRQPSIETLIQLSDIFEKSISDLIGHNFVSKRQLDEEYGESQLIELLVKHLIKKDEKEFIELFKNFILLKYDVNRIIDNILKEVMYEVGNLWELGKITEADEHYATNIVRKAVNYLSIKTGSKLMYDKAISFSIGTEKHTLGLEMVKTYLDSIGVETIHIGNNVTIRSIEKMIKEYKPSYIFISITMDENMNILSHFIQNIKAKYQNKICIGIGGQGYRKNDEIEAMSNVHIFKTINGLKQLVKNNQINT